MSDDILKVIDTLGAKTVSRRSFLRGGAIAAALVGAAAAAPTVLHGQEQQQSQDQQSQQQKKDGTKQQDPDQSSSDSSGDSETKLDAEGREYRVCPQCGGNMYRQGRTWTCENCGYSYVE